MKERTALSEFFDEFDQQLCQMGYESTTLSQYRKSYRELHEFAEQQGAICFSEDLAHLFLKECYGLTVYSKTRKHRESSAIRTVNALNDFFLYGEYKRLYLRKAPVVLPEYYQSLLDEFLDYLRQLYRAKATVYRYTNMLRTFFVHLNEQGIDQCEQITVSVIHNYMDSLKRFCSSTVKANNTMLQEFFRFLLEAGYSENDLSSCLPHIRCYRAALIPSVWKKEDVEKLIGAIDRGSPCGKRDLAILLLVIQMGLRASDIRGIQLSNLKWSTKPNGSYVELVQAKTGELLSAPMPADVAIALIDYLKNGRPKSKETHVFLCHRAPFKPFSDNNGLNNIIFRLAERAGIKFTNDMKHGMHSLRHTFATNLISNGVSLEVASGLLGHVSTQNTDIYIKTDIAALRGCALNPVEVIHE